MRSAAHMRSCILLSQDWNAHEGEVEGAVMSVNHLGRNEKNPEACGVPLRFSGHLCNSKVDIHWIFGLADV
jgi:hypothetical protein